MSIIIVREINKLTTVRFSFYLSVMPTTKESTVNTARMQSNGGTCHIPSCKRVSSLLRLISWSPVSVWKEEARLPAQSPHSKGLLAAHGHPERYGCGVTYTCMLDHTEEQSVLANLEPGQILLFCEDLQEIEKYMLQQTFLMNYLLASLSLSPSPSSSPHLSLPGSLAYTS